MLSKRQSQSILTLALFALTCLTRIPLPTTASPSKLPEVSSTLLKTHRLYLLQPPHDTSLYDALEVSPNATVADLTKQYRKLSRRLHPDKQQTDDDNNNNRCTNVAEELQRVRQAYDILKDDATRLPYHRYGLQEIEQAVWILTGSNKMQNLDASTLDLLKLMGYNPSDSIATTTTTPTSRSQQRQHARRVYYLVANLLEKIRPLVEGVVSEAAMANAVIRECDALKALPLGAQVLRCIGRAYRHAGKRALRQIEANKKFTVNSLVLSDSVRDGLRHAKHVWNAAVASGRVVLSEQLEQQRPQTNAKRNLPRIEYHFDDGSEFDSDDDSDVLTDQQLREQEHFKARKAVQESLQVEALWKIRKMDLDRTIRQACELILEGNYFFFPSHQSTQAPYPQGGSNDGWIGSSGIAIDAETGRLRAAKALVLLGNIMVQRSKEGTSWME